MIFIPCKFLNFQYLSKVFLLVGSGNIANVFMNCGSAKRAKTVTFTDGSSCDVINSKFDSDPANGCRMDAINFCCMAVFFERSLVVFVEAFLLPGGRPRGRDIDITGVTVVVLVVEVIGVLLAIVVITLIGVLTETIGVDVIALGVTAGLFPPVGV